MKPQQNGSDCYESDPFTRSWITSNLVFLASLLRFLYCFFFFFFSYTKLQRAGGYRYIRYRYRERKVWGDIREGEREEDSGMKGKEDVGECV